MTQKIDGIIFDMDGTLWDAVQSYCDVWNETIAHFGIKRSEVKYDELVVLMGKHLRDIYDCLIGDCFENRELFIERLIEDERRMIPVIGGKLYEGVDETLEKLGKQCKLFMVSNCSADGLNNFLTFTGLSHHFVENLTYGSTGVDKSVNIRRLLDKYNLKRAVYVGDIQKDADSTHAAGIEFVHAAYGFGKVSDAEFSIQNFKELETIVLNNGN